MKLLLTYGALLLALAAVQLAFARHELPLALPLAGAAFVTGAAMLLGRGAGSARTAPRAIVEASPGAALLGAGVVTGVMGAQIGLWAILVGSGAGMAGAGLLGRERRSQRAAERRGGGSPG